MGTTAATRTTKHLPTEIPENNVSRFLFADTRMAWVWLAVRLYVGWGWLHAGWEKLHNPVWAGAKVGTALGGFVAGALKKAGGAHPDVQGWYAAFLQGFVQHHLTLFSYVVSYGETLVGVALILGVVTGIAAFFGCFMNMNYLLAGTVSVNPVWFVLALFLILAWRVGGWYGADRWILAELGTPWEPGAAFHHRPPQNAG